MEQITNKRSSWRILEQSIPKTPRRRINFSLLFGAVCKHPHIPGSYADLIANPQFQFPVTLAGDFRFQCIPRILPVQFQADRWSGGGDESDGSPYGGVGAAFRPGADFQFER